MLSHEESVWIHKHCWADKKIGNFSNYHLMATAKNVGTIFGRWKSGFKKVPSISAYRVCMCFVAICKTLYYLRITAKCFAQSAKYIHTSTSYNLEIKPISPFGYRVSWRWNSFCGTEELYLCHRVTTLRLIKILIVLQHFFAHTVLYRQTYGCTHHFFADSVFLFPCSRRSDFGSLISSSVATSCILDFSVEIHRCDKYAIC